jgi:hypothetical protein
MAKIYYDDFLKTAKTKGCNVNSDFVWDKERRGKLLYPHIHIWSNGNMALSAGKGPANNVVFGRDEEITTENLTALLDLLGDNLKSGPLYETFKWAAIQLRVSM